MKYFSVEESQCPCGCGQVVKSGHPIWSAASRIREVIGKPMTITSGYRCRIYNQTLKNSAKHSKHIEGCALDLSTVNLTGNEKYCFVEEAMKFGLRIGIYQNHIHIDYSPGEHRVLWWGNY